MVLRAVAIAMPKIEIIITDGVDIVGRKFDWATYGLKLSQSDGPVDYFVEVRCQMMTEILLLVAVVALVMIQWTLRDIWEVLRRK